MTNDKEKTLSAVQYMENKSSKHWKIMNSSYEHDSQKNTLPILTFYFENIFQN